MIRKRIAGFTLLELIITLALAAIIVTVAVPAFQETISRNRRATQANDLVSALSLARSEAIKRGEMVTICQSDDQASCTEDEEWEKGWLVFVDSNAAGGDNVGELDAGEELLRVYQGLSGGNTLRVTDTFEDYLSYLPDGLSLGSDGLANGTFSLCDYDEDETEARYIVINVTGRVRVRDYDAAEGDECP